MNNEPLISVIVPVYNVEQYLDRCLQSIVGQTYARLEILVVDDGSTDGCPSLCDQWAQRDSRIRVIHKSNGGLSDARNAAMDVMTGEMVTMIDSDDWVEPAYVSTLLTLMRDTDADIAVGGWSEVDENGKIVGFVSNMEKKPITYSRDQALHDIFYQKDLTHSAWGRLYKSELFNDLRYPVGMLYEDLAIAYPLYSRSTRVAQCFTPLYNYLQRDNSILGTFKPQRTHVLDLLDALEKQVVSVEPELLPAVRSRRLSAHFNILLLCPDKPEYKSIRERCWNGIRQLRWKCFLDPCIRLKNRMGIVASMLGMNIFLKVFSHHR